MPEGFAAVGIARRDLERGARQTQRAARAGHPLGDHHLVEDFVRAMFLSDQVFGRDARLAEIDPSRAAAARPQQTVHVLDFHPRAALDQQRADGLLTGRVGVSARVHHEQVRALRPDDETLLAV